MGGGGETGRRREKGEERGGWEGGGRGGRGESRGRKSVEGRARVRE